ncbi:MAG TPA: c-type cytochrome domain-containing protein [Humisphaera sp.]
MTRLAVPLSCVILLLASPALAAADDEKPVSFARDVQPIFAKACVACHKPEKKKGKLDLTTYAALMAGGEEGKAVVPGDPAKSSLVVQIVPHGDEKPAMPEKGDPLSAADVAVIRRWVAQGAKDDTPAGRQAKAGYAQPGPTPPAEPPVYKVAPVVNAIAMSPDGKTLAVAGRGEVLLLDPESGDVKHRLPTGSARVTSLAFSADGATLASAGGAPGEFGHLIAWEMAAPKVLHNWRLSGDTLFGLSLSPDGTLAAVGCADRSVRVVRLADGKETLNLTVHTEWVLATAFGRDGKTLVTTGRDKALKVIDLATAKAVDVNEPQDPFLCLARSPAEDVVVAGGATGEPRLFKVADLKMRTEKEKDPNRLKICEKVPAATHAVAFSPDGKLFAACGTPDAKVYTKDGSRVATLAGAAGPVYAAAFSPDGARVYAAGFDGRVRAHDSRTGKVVKEYVPAPFGK